MSSLTQKISKVFVIHYKKLTNRKEYLINYFKSKNITNYEFRNNFQREDLTTDIVNHYFKSNKFERENLSTKAAESYFKLNNFDNVTTDIADFYFKLNILNSAQICITIEHIETYKEIVNRTSDNDDSWYLILEDDAINIHPDFNKIILDTFKLLPNDWDILLLGFLIKIGENETLKTHYSKRGLNLVGNTHTKKLSV
jgi:hypothetical protein